LRDRELSSRTGDLALPMAHRGLARGDIPRRRRVVIRGCRRSGRNEQAERRRDAHDGCRELTPPPVHNVTVVTIGKIGTL